MRPAICAAIDYCLPFAKAQPLIRGAGFDCISLGARPEHSGYDAPEGRRRIRQLTEQYGLSIDSVHAPFPEGDRLCSLVEAERQASVRHCETAIEAAHELQVGIVVVHLNTVDDPDRQQMMMDQGIRSVERLARYASERGVRIALENSWGQAYAVMLERVMASADPQAVGFCYDSGHENVNRAGFPELLEHGPRLLTVHLHDNCGEDTHVLPYEGDIDWALLMELLRGLGYSGNLLLEAGIANSRFKDPAVFVQEAWARTRRLLESP